MHDFAAVLAKCPTDEVQQRLRPRASEDGLWLQDALPEKQPVKESIETADVATVSNQRADNVSADPQLHLLDFQLRHILKSTARDEGSAATADSVKSRNAMEGSPSRSPAHARSLMSHSGGATRDHGLLPVDQQCSRKPPQCGSTRGELLDRQVSGGRSDGNEPIHFDMSRSRSSRSVERGRRPSYGRKDPPDDGPAQPSDDRKPVTDVACSGSGITFGGIEELSHGGNVNIEDLPTTNVYLDDHATKAAPYTIASQFYSLGSEADDDGSVTVPDKKIDEDGTCNVSPVYTADKARRPVTLTRPSLSTAERAIEQHSERSSSIQFARTTVVSRALSANGSLTPDGYPRPRFSVRSPSSPARLSGEVVEGRPVQKGAELVDCNGIVGDVSPPRDDCLPAAPLAAQELDGSEAVSTSDVEAGILADQSGNVVLGPVTAQALKSEPRGPADGESQRVLSERIDMALQSEKVYEQISSCSANEAASCCRQPPNMFARLTADFPDIGTDSKTVPMSVVKKIADCLDVSLGSDKEVKEIVWNGVPAATDRVDRIQSGAPTSRFAVVPKTALAERRRSSADKVPNSAKAVAVEPIVVGIGRLCVPNVVDGCPSIPPALSDGRILSSSAGQSQLSAAVANSRCDDSSDTRSLVLVKTEPFSSPEHLPRPPNTRVSKKAAIANRARCVSVAVLT